MRMLRVWQSELFRGWQVGGFVTEDSQHPGNKHKFMLQRAEILASCVGCMLSESVLDLTGHIRHNPACQRC